MDDDIVDFVIAGMRPLSIVEDEAFIKLCRGISFLVYIKEVTR